MIKKTFLLLNILVNKLTSNTVNYSYYIKMPENYENKVNYLIKNKIEDLVLLLKLNPDCNFRIEQFKENIKKESIKCYGKKDAKKYMRPLLIEYIEQYLKLMPEYAISHKEELAFIFDLVETLYIRETL